MATIGSWAIFIKQQQVHNKSNFQEKSKTPVKFQLIR